MTNYFDIWNNIVFGFYTSFAREKKIDEFSEILMKNAAGSVCPFFACGAQLFNPFMWEIFLLIDGVQLNLLLFGYWWSSFGAQPEP